VWFRAIRFSLVVFLVVRVVVSLLGLTVGTIAANPVPPAPGTSVPATSGIHNLWDGLDRLDAAWFTLIADRGYDAAPNSAAFFPGYPLAIRAVEAVGIGPLGAAIVVSNIAFAAALILLYRLTTKELSEPDARRAVVLLAAFPTSFFFLAPYSESLFLLLVLLTFLLVRDGSWVGGGVAGAAAAATRSIGIVLVPGLLVEAWRQRSARPSTIGKIACTAIVLVGPLAYAVWWQLHSQHPLAPIEAQDQWHRVVRFPLVTLGMGLSEAVDTALGPDGGYWFSDLVLTGVAIVGLIAIRRRVPITYLVYGWASLLIVLSFPYPGRELTSVSRFVLVIFPAFWGLATLLRGRWLFRSVVTVSGVAGAWHAVLFMHWRHIY
jgi:hypothetical protein